MALATLAERQKVLRSAKGGHTRPKRRILQILEEQFPEYNSVVEMARMAQDESNDLALRLTANKEVAKYCFPQLKAVDLTSAGEGITFNFSIGQQQPTNIIDDDIIDTPDGST